jgi:PAS domain-containing protein
MNATIAADWPSALPPSAEPAGNDHIQFHQFIESESEAVLLHDGETIFEANQRAAELFGCYREDIPRRTLYQLLSPVSHVRLKHWLDAQANDRIALFGQHRSGRVFTLYFKPLAQGRLNGNHVMVTILTDCHLLASDLKSFLADGEACSVSPERLPSKATADGDLTHMRYAVNGSKYDE